MTWEKKFFPITAHTLLSYYYYHDKLIVVRNIHIIIWYNDVSNMMSNSLISLFYAHLDCCGSSTSPMIVRAIAITAISPRCMSYITITLNYWIRQTNIFLIYNFIVIKMNVRSFLNHSYIIKLRTFWTYEKLIVAKYRFTCFSFLSLHFFTLSFRQKIFFLWIS